MKLIQVIGHLGKDAELVNIENKDFHTLMFNIAHTEKWTDKDGQEKSRTDWFTCFQRFKKDPDNIKAILKKGLKVFVSGVPNFQVRQHENGIFPQITIDVNTLEFMAKREDSDDGFEDK